MPAPLPPWICPVCSADLEAIERRYACANGHSFDRAKEGYVNLLLAQHKKTADPGDGPAMMQARREFLSTGHYDFLAERIAAGIRQHGVDRPRVLDAGCGEGHYLDSIRQLLNKGPGRTEVEFGGLGIDISRAAVRMAAKRYPQLRFAVASSFRLPLPPESLDVVVQVFAPGEPAEYRRILSDGGLLAIASPGPRHLFQIKQRIYDRPREHVQEKEKLPGFTPIEDERLQRRLTLESSREIAALLGMTPLYWRADPETQQAVTKLDRLEVELDFRLRVWRKEGG
jgi:23S rRNA (guanine745-N1)-methyltransferase